MGYDVFRVYSGHIPFIPGISKNTKYIPYSRLWVIPIISHYSPVEYAGIHWTMWDMIGICLEYYILEEYIRNTYGIHTEYVKNMLITNHPISITNHPAPDERQSRNHTN